MFVHVPFLMKVNSSDVERISTFRETESLMLKGGAAFTEVILLQHEFQQISGDPLFLKKIFGRTNFCFYRHFT